VALDSRFVLPIVMCVLAPFVGSFLGLLAVRLPGRRDVISGRSRCDRCGATLRARDIVPFASWLLLRGRCRYCGEPIGMFAPFMEISALALAAWAALATTGCVLIATCLFGWILLTLAATDWRAFLLPDALTLPLAVLGFLAALAFDRDGLLDHLIGGAAGFIVLAAIAFAYRRLRGRDGLGLGDAKLLGAVGMWVAWQGLLTVVLYAAIAALAVILARALLGQAPSATMRIPFGAYLAAGAWLVWLYGPLSLSANPG